LSRGRTREPIEMPQTVDAAKLLRAGVLEDVGVLVAGAPSERDLSQRPTFAVHVATACTALGARVQSWSAADGEDGEARVPAGVDVLVVDGAALFDADAPETPVRSLDPAGARDQIARAALRDCLDGAWQVSHAVANAAFIAAQRRGRIIYIAPACARGENVAGALADAARAGLENLARTLSIEWARYEITTATIAPGVSTSGEEVAALCAYLASPAGAYFSGCQLDLRGTRAPSGAR
jgi:NAD(P)-dependent dehydrogenase (short-subunit alcohol dehydrogenase family)